MSSPYPLAYLRRAGRAVAVPVAAVVVVQEPQRLAHLQCQAPHRLWVVQRQLRLRGRAAAERRAVLLRHPAREAQHLWT